MSFSSSKGTNAMSLIRSGSNMNFWNGECRELHSINSLPIVHFPIRHSIRVIRQSLPQLTTSASLSPSRALFVSTSQTLDASDQVEISVVYFRACYTPNDFSPPSNAAHSTLEASRRANFPSTDDLYATRVLLQRSRAINCPTIALQLAGAKKVQEVLTRPGVLENFLLSESNNGVEEGGEARISEQDVKDVRASWVGMWGLDEPASKPDASGNFGQEDGMHRTLASHTRLVLKPQREGGGNNVYGPSIPAFLEKLPKEEHAAWVAMEMIEPPKGVGNWLVRTGEGPSSVARQADVVSELGIFGWSLFGRSESEVKQDAGGWLLRTKGRESNEGGVAVGFSVLDSVLLVD